MTVRMPLATAILFGLFAGCSALVDPDPARLGAGDMSARDMGTGTDAQIDGNTMACPGGCDDGVSCTLDECIGGACVRTPDDASCAEGEQCNPASGCTTDRCTSDAECGDDSVTCNGVETCTDEGRCVVLPAIPCDDSDPCTEDLCDPAAGGCVAQPVDGDGDGAPAAMVDGATCEGGTDCDDDDPSRAPGAAESCDGIDQDCDRAIDEGAPLCSPSGDTCEDLVVVPLDGSGVGTYTGTLGAAVGDDYDTECDGGDGRELVFAVDFSGIADFEIDTLGSDFDTVVAAGTSCGDFRLGGRGCNDDIAGSELRSRLWVHRVGQIAVAGRLYILVSGYQATDVGDVVLTIRRSSAAADSCAGPLDITGGGSVLGFAGGAASPTGRESGSCQTFAERFDPEGIFSLEPQRQRLRLRAYSDAFGPELYVRLECGNGELFCVDNDTGSGRTDIDADIPLEFLPRDVNVFVDGAGNGDAYTLDYTP